MGRSETRPRPGVRPVAPAIPGKPSQPGPPASSCCEPNLRLRIKNSRLIRPPGVNDEEAFLSKCLRCSECMKVCPTSGLQPVQSEAGLEGVWTPTLMPRVGYCDYGCNACGQVCPSGAIPSLSLDQKRLAVIGTAIVNRNRCLPWASDTPCIVCEEMCPTRRSPSAWKKSA